jgi:hypothetical protein
MALIDAEDLERAQAFKWQTKSKKSTPGKYYVQRSYRVAGRNLGESLHRFLMGCVPGDGKVVDHRNGNGLDNRKDNLRVTDARGNATNVTRSKNQSRGGYKGVSWHPKAGKWQASICSGEPRPNGKRKQIYLGLFEDPEEAARAYDAEARLHFGEFAALNFPEVRRAG